MRLLGALGVFSGCLLLRSYFKDGLQTIAHFGTYINDLSAKLNTIKQKQDEERKKLVDLRALLRSAPDFERIEVSRVLDRQSDELNRCVKTQSLTTDKGTGYSLHQLQGDKNHGITKSGHLLKKSEGKVRRVWQKRRCRITADGFLDIYHADESKPPTRVNLLTCQIKPVLDDKRCFDLISCESVGKRSLRRERLNRLCFSRQSAVPFPSGGRQRAEVVDIGVDQLQREGSDQNVPAHRPPSVAGPD